jgi:pimeloyl-ACP methyl ester carboxylesterase
MKMPLILLPGFAADQDIWNHQVEHLREIAQPQVIVLDRQSSRSEMANEVLKLAPSQFALAGHSMGGWVAQEVAAKAPERVSSLILISTWASNNPEMIAGQETSVQLIEQGKIEELFGFLLPMLVYSKNIALLPQIKEVLRRRPARVLCNQLRAMNDAYETLPLLKNIFCPTLLIHGRHDALFTPEEQMTIAKGLPKSRLTIIEECGHMAPVEQPQATTALMRLWLESTL